MQGEGKGGTAWIAVTVTKTRGQSDNMALQNLRI